MPARAAEEEGFGLIELLFAIVMLNIGILTLVAAFQTGALALARSSATSNGAAVADKTMEIFRSLQNCEIFLQAPTGGGSDTGTPAVPASGAIPNSTSSWYSKYFGDTAAYASSLGTSKFAYNTTTPWWATGNSTYSNTSYSGIAAAGSCSAPSGLPSGSPDPTRAIQYVTGPDGESYPVLIYIVVTQPSGSTWTAGYVKQVTVTVLDPRTATKILARESSYFDPNVTG